MKSRMSVLVLVALVAALALPMIALADDSTTTATPAAGSTTEKPAAPAKAMKAEPRVDLNSASKDDLMKVDGITSDIADKIIAARPLKTKYERVTKKIVTRAEYAKFRTHVVAKQAAEKKS